LGFAHRVARRCALGLNRGEFISVAVNVSVRQLEEPGYANSVLAFLKEYSFPPNRLEIELIERSLMFSGDQVLQQLEQLRLAGVRITLDDFGTEQSCLSLLHKLPIDTIKLDRSFIRVMDTEPAVVPIIQAIVSMAQSLGKRIVAEAIEHVGPVPALMKMGTMDFQGYLLSRPVAAEEMQLVIGIGGRDCNAGGVSRREGGRSRDQRLDSCGYGQDVKVSHFRKSFSKIIKQPPTGKCWSADFFIRA